MEPEQEDLLLEHLLPEGLLAVHQQELGQLEVLQLVQECPDVKQFL